MMNHYWAFFLTNHVEPLRMYKLATIHTLWAVAEQNQIHENTTTGHHEPVLSARIAIKKLLLTIITNNSHQKTPFYVTMIATMNHYGLIVTNNHY